MGNGPPYLRVKWSEVL